MPQNSSEKRSWKVQLTGDLETEYDNVIWTLVVNVPFDFFGGQYLLYLTSYTTCWAKIIFGLISYFGERFLPNVYTNFLTNTFSYLYTFYDAFKWIYIRTFIASVVTGDDFCAKRPDRDDNGSSSSWTADSGHQRSRLWRRISTATRFCLRRYTRTMTDPEILKRAGGTEDSYCVSAVVINRKCTQRTVCLLCRENGFLKKI